MSTTSQQQSGPRRRGDRTAGNPLGRTLLIALAAFGVVAALLAALYWALHVEKSIGMHYSFDVTIAEPENLRPDLPGGIDAEFSQVTITPFEHPATAKTMEALAVSSRYLVGLLTCLTVTGLSLSLLRRRAVGPVTSWWLGGLGVLMAVVAVVEPWLSRTSVVRAVEALGLPTSSEATGKSLDEATWVAPQVWDWTDTDWFLLMLGLVTVVTAGFLLRTRRLQDDTEGLI